MLVEARTKLINHVRGAVKSFGARSTKCSTPCFHKKAPAQFPEELRIALTPLIETGTGLTENIRSCDKEIERLCVERYGVELIRLRQPG